MSTHIQRAISSTLPSNWPTFIELDELRLSLSNEELRLSLDSAFYRAVERMTDEARVEDEHEAWPVQETASAFSFDNLPFETLKAQSAGIFDAEYEDQATAECVAYGTCQSCNEDLGVLVDCDCLCHAYV